MGNDKINVVKSLVLEIVNSSGGHIHVDRVLQIAHLVRRNCAIANGDMIYPDRIFNNPIGPKSEIMEMVLMRENVPSFFDGLLHIDDDDIIHLTGPISLSDVDALSEYDASYISYYCETLSSYNEDQILDYMSDTCVEWDQGSLSVITIEDFADRVHRADPRGKEGLIDALKTGERIDAAWDLVRSNSI